MGLWDKLFGQDGKRREIASTEAAPDAGGGGQWRHILIPAFHQPFSRRSLEVAYRLARGTNATLHLTYLLEVPRSFALEALLPEEEIVASEALSVAQADLTSCRIPIQASVQRARSVRDGILKIIAQDNIDLLVLGTRVDEQRGLPRDLARDLFYAAPCEVIIDHVAGDK